MKRHLSLVQELIIKIEEVMAELPPLEPSTAAVDLMLGVGRLQVQPSAAL